MSSYGRRDLISNNKLEAYDRSSELTRNLNGNLKNIINNRTISEKKMKMPTSAVIETIRPEFSRDDWEFDDKEDVLEMTPKEYMLDGVFDTSSNQEISSTYQELIIKLHQCLRRSQDGALGGQRILLPADMLPGLAKEVMRMAENEPYGIRGVLINMHLEQQVNKKDKTVTLGKVESTSYVAATFVVNITLKEDVSRWNSFKELLGGLLGRKELYLAPGYKIVKEKLYRSSSPTLSC